MKGKISLGLVEGMAPEIAASWIAGFMDTYPNVTFRIHDGNSDDLIEMLRSGIISLAVITPPCDQSLLNSFAVGNEAVTVMLPKSHPLAALEAESGNRNSAENTEMEEISIDKLIGENLIVPGRKATIELIYKWFKAYKAEPKIVCEMDSYLDAVALTRMGVGVAIYPRTEFIPNDSLVFKRIKGEDKKMEYLFVWLKGHPLPTLEEKFIDHIKSVV